MYLLMDIILELVQKICAHMGWIVLQQPAAGYWRSRSADFAAGCLNSYDILLQFTPTPVFEKFLFDKGAKSNDIFIVCFNKIKYALDKWDRIAYNNIRT